MDENEKYSINLNAAYGPLQKIDVKALAQSVSAPWFNQTLCEVNDCVVRLGVFKGGEFHWHKHDMEDEFFFVLSGRFVVETEGKLVELQPHQGLLVPRGVVHKTSSPEPSVILMFEATTVKPTGD